MDNSKKIILIIDDDEEMTRLLRIELEQEEYEVFLAHDGSEGFKQIREKKPDVIILDIMMHGMDGCEMMKILKIDDATRDIPVVVLSAKTREKDIELGKELGAELYIVKPFDPIELIEGIHKVSGRE